MLSLIAMTFLGIVYIYIMYAKGDAYILQSSKQSHCVSPPNHHLKCQMTANFHTIAGDPISDTPNGGAQAGGHDCWGRTGSDERPRLLSDVIRKPI